MIVPNMRVVLKHAKGNTGPAGNRAVATVVRILNFGQLIEVSPALYDLIGIERSLFEADELIEVVQVIYKGTCNECGAEHEFGVVDCMNAAATHAAWTNPYCQKCGAHHQPRMQRVIYDTPATQH